MKVKSHIKESCLIHVENILCCKPRLLDQDLDSLPLSQQYQGVQMQHCHDTSFPSSPFTASARLSTPHCGQGVHLKRPQPSLETIATSGKVVLQWVSAHLCKPSVKNQPLHVSKHTRSNEDTSMCKFIKHVQQYDLQKKEEASAIIGVALCCISDRLNIPSPIRVQVWPNTTRHPYLDFPCFIDYQFDLIFLCSCSL